MGDFNNNNEDSIFNNGLLNSYMVVDLYDNNNNNNNNNYNNNNSFITSTNYDLFSQQPPTNDYSIPLTESLQSLLPPTSTVSTNNNIINNTIDININHLNTINNDNNNNIINNNNTTPIYQINHDLVNNNNNNNYYSQQLKQIQEIHQQIFIEQNMLNNAQVPTTTIATQTPTNLLMDSNNNNNSHVGLLVPQTYTLNDFGVANTNAINTNINSNSNIIYVSSDNSSPEFSYGSPSSPSTSNSSPSSNYDLFQQQPQSPLQQQQQTQASANIPIVPTSATSETAKSSKDKSSKDKSSKKEKEREKEKEKERIKEEEEDDDRPKKKKKFEPNVYVGVDLGEDLLEITSEEFQAYKNNFFSNVNDKKTQTVLNYQYRKIKNRESARRSRERKANHVEELEGKISEIEKERDLLKEENTKIKQENIRLREELDMIKIQDKQKSATSIFDYVSIGSPTTQNFSKNFGIILFIFLFGSFILQNANPFSNNNNNNLINMNNNHNIMNNLNNNNNNNQHVNSIIYQNIPNSFNEMKFQPFQPNQHSSNQMKFKSNQPSFFNTQYNNIRNTLGRQPDRVDEEEEEDDDLSTESISVSPSRINPHVVPDDQPSTLLDRSLIRNWATLPQNSVASITFEKDSALDLLEKANIDKSRHNVFSHYKQLYEDDDFDLFDESPKSNNIENKLINGNDNGDNSNKDDLAISPSTSTSNPPTTTTTVSPRYVNNCTLSLSLKPTQQTFSQELLKSQNVTTFGQNSSFKFNFLIDTHNFPNGSNDVSKAFLESTDQEMTVTSIIIAIEKKQQPQQQPQHNTN